MADHTDIIYTKVDEAPELASGSLLPIIRAFLSPAGITVGVKDISLAGRILAQFPDRLPAEATDYLRSMECDLIDEDDVDDAWLTTMADSPYPGPIRDEIKSLANHVEGMMQ